MLAHKMLMRLRKIVQKIQGIFIGSDNLPPVIATSTASTATAYSNQRKLDRTSNGVLWVAYLLGYTGGAQYATRYSNDDGVTWSSPVAVNDGQNVTYSGNCSFYIDQDDYAHIVYKDVANGFIYYRRGTPNTGRTAWTWSAATAIHSTPAGDCPDVVAHREGTGWKVHIVQSYLSATTNRAQYTRLNVTSTGTISFDVQDTAIGGSYSVANSVFASIDFNHTGDGKTVANGTPHLYVAWSAGAAGAGKGIRFKKATYNAGVWTWGTEREIDSTRHLASGIDTWMMCLFDGTRIVVTGLFAPFAYDLALYERDAADTTTDTRVLITDADSTTYLISSSAAYDADGNIYIVGVDRSGADGTNKLNYRMWDRQALALGPIVTVDSSARNFPYVSAKRGYSGDRIEFIYTDGTASPYSIKYSYVGGPVELYPAQITTSTAATATAYSNQRKIDRTSNGVLWTMFWSAADTQWKFYYSIDEGVTWTLGATQANSPVSYTPNASFFIDQDDYAHFVYKAVSDGSIYYRRGTPNAARTAWTWSAAVGIRTSDANANYPDVIAHREGTGWVVHTTHSFTGGITNLCRYTPLTVTSGGSITLGTALTISNDYGASNHTYPSIDFNHTGDGKTVKDGTPHLYVAWSAGATGAGKGIRFKKATYSGGSWTWGTEREIDSTRYTDGLSYWLNCLFDGSRIIIGAFALGLDLMLYERDAADTTTITRLLIDNATVDTYLFTGSISYDGGGNVYILGRDAFSSGNRLNFRKWDRNTEALGEIQTVMTITANSPYISTKRGYSSNKIEFIFLNGTASPYPIMYGAIV